MTEKESFPERCLGITNGLWWVRDLGASQSMSFKFMAIYVDSLFLLVELLMITHEHLRYAGLEYASSCMKINDCIYT